MDGIASTDIAHFRVRPGVDELAFDLRRAIEDGRADPERRAVIVTRLLDEVFCWQRAPLAKSVLLDLFAALAGVVTVSEISLERASGPDEEGKAPVDRLSGEQTTPEETVVAESEEKRLRDGFRQFLEEGRLSRAKRCAVLLRLQRAFLLGWLGLSAAAVARHAEVDPEVFESRIWPRLPLADLEIADLLGRPTDPPKPAQDYVAINRKRAMEEDWPKWAQVRLW
jgi:hypothetical protein